MQKRCPWCGKKVVVRGLSQLLNHKKQKTPLRFIFDKCSFCGQYYGQQFKTPRVVWGCFLIIASMVLVCLWSSLIVICLGLIFVICMYIIQGPLVPMNEEEEAVEVHRELLSANLETPMAKLKRGMIYLLDRNTDTSQAFTCVSPIRIIRIDKTKKLVWFYFLYEHEKNEDAFSQGSFTLFDGTNSVADLKNAQYV